MATTTTTDSKYGSGFGSFVYMCHNVPSYPWCNLFYRQLQSTGGVTLPPPATAPVGINIDCGIPKSGDGSLGNIANMVVCGVSIIITALLILQVSRRRAAVGGTPITVLTAIHAAIVALLFWFLFWNGVVATQIVEDGTLSSLIVSSFSPEPSVYSLTPSQL
ncbi:hypothetical protein M408DRAFT_258253 [Serendipita vermifera MAFF 305830]|uniref:Uncharacterized protein n=1 Tax=Serendipita vermifera MAFF 305830 TaxID=933852 RepID=A0A0C3B3G1_SERVB|nr:hypothetical protein M408DRAFT_258253 [Serendipita vermifera MAFF 305830]